MIGLLLMAMLWQNDSAEALNRISGGAPAYITSAADRVRWERLRDARRIYESKHRCYYLDESRTQFNYKEMQVQERTKRPYFTFNILRLISIKTADLLFGGKAKLDAPTPQQTDPMDELARRSFLHPRLHGVTVQVSWGGGGFLESSIWRGQTYIEVVPCDEMFPIGKLQPDGQYAAYVRYAKDTAVISGQAMSLLLKTTYLPGVIHRELFKLDDKGTVNGEIADLALWPAFAGRTLEKDSRTGIDENTITYLANELGGQIEVSDFDGLIELQDVVNAKIAQMAVVIAKHADPKLAAPEAVANPNGALPSAAHDVYFFRSKDEIPQYITWSAELDAAMHDRDAAVDALCVAGEFPPELLGIRRGVTAESARKMKLMASPALAKVGRKALLIEPAIARAVLITQKLDQSTGLLKSYPLDPIGVHMRDGLPVDTLDVATEAQTWSGTGSISDHDLIAMRIEDPDSAAAEEKRVAAKKTAATPSILLGGGLSGVESGEETNPPIAPQAQEQTV